MKKLVVVILMSVFLMNACSSVGLNVGTSIIPGVYIGTTGTLNKSDIKKMKNKEEKKEKLKKDTKIDKN